MNPITKLACLGAGRMGQGIALAFAYAGYEVTVVDFKARASAEFEALRLGFYAEVRSNLHALFALQEFELSERGKNIIEQIVSRIQVCAYANANHALFEAQLVFEAVPETLEAKRDAFSRLCPLVSSDCILASTTSTILVTDLVPMVTHAERLLNAHWLNPAYVVPLVEISKHEGTALPVLERLKALLEAIGKVPIVCGPAPGFIVPRLQALVMNEAARMVEEGVASADEIDKATRFGFGFRFAALGVVEFIDYGGNDILYHASRYLSNALSPERYTAPAIVDRLMHEGKLGLKTGEGFYDYRSVDQAAYRRDALKRLLAQLSQMGLQRPPVIGEANG